MKPPVIEFIGVPNSGKSTNIKLVKKSLSNAGYRVLAIDEEFGKSKVKPKGGYFYNVLGLIKCVSLLLENHNKYEIILLDRGPVDLHIFCDTLFDKKHLSETEYHSLKKLTKELSTLVSFCYLFVCKTNTSLARDEKHSKGKNGFIMNKEFLDALKVGYKKNETTVAKVIDSESATINEGVNIIMKNIMNVLEKSS